jgi:hypothetical protein
MPRTMARPLLGLRRILAKPGGHIVRKHNPHWDAQYARKN